MSEQRWKIERGSDGKISGLTFVDDANAALDLEPGERLYLTREQLEGLARLAAEEERTRILGAIDIAGGAYEAGIRPNAKPDSEQEGYFDTGWCEALDYWVERIERGEHWKNGGSA